MNIKKAPLYLMLDYVTFREWDAYFLKLGAPKVVGLRIIDLPEADDPFVYKVTVAAKLDDGRGCVRSWIGINSAEELSDKLTRWVQAISKNRIPQSTKVFLPEAANGSTPAL